MRNLSHIKHMGKLFGLFNGGGTNQYGLTGGMAAFHFLHYSTVLASFRFENHIRQIFTLNRFIGRNLDNRETINLNKFLLFCFCSTSHAGQLVIHSEIILEGNGSQSLAFSLNFQPFLGFDGLMKSVGIAAAIHETTGKFINNDHFTVFNYIVLIPLHHGLSTEGLNEKMVQLQIFRIIQIFHMKHFFHLCNPGFCRSHGFLFFIDGVVFIFFQMRHQLGHDIVIICRFLTGAGNNQRCTSFIDKNRVYFIDQAVMKGALHHLVQGGNHVIAKVVKAEFIIRSVGNIGIISNLSLLEIQVMDNEAYGKAEEFIDLSHPFAVALCQVIIDRNDVNAFPFQGIQVNRSGSYQGFTFTGTHFSNITAVENNTANQLHIEMAHAQYATGRFADNCKGFRKDIVQCFALGQTSLEFVGLISQGRITQLLQSIFQGINLLFYDLANLLYFFFVGSVKQPVKKLIKHGNNSLYNQYSIP